MFTSEELEARLWAGANDLRGSMDASQDDFQGLFSQIDLTDSALGANLNARSKNISKLIQIFADLSIIDLQHNDIIGDAYEYLIGQFAMESGKKAGEFYTPHQVSDVIARIVAHSVPALTSIYDPCVGSGSLLLTVKYYLDELDAQISEQEQAFAAMQAELVVQ